MHTQEYAAHLSAGLAKIQKACRPEFTEAYQLARALIAEMQKLQHIVRDNQHLDHSDENPGINAYFQDFIDQMDNAIDDLRGIKQITPAELEERKNAYHRTMQREFRGE